MTPKAFRKWVMSRRATLIKDVLRLRVRSYGRYRPDSIAELRREFLAVAALQVLAKESDDRDGARADDLRTLAYHFITRRLDEEGHDFLDRYIPAIHERFEELMTLGALSPRLSYYISVWFRYRLIDCYPKELYQKFAAPDALSQDDQIPDCLKPFTSHVSVPEGVTGSPK